MRPTCPGRWPCILKFIWTCRSQIGRSFRLSHYLPKLVTIRTGSCRGSLSVYHHHHKGDFMKLNSLASHTCTNRHKNFVFVVDRRSRKLTCFFCVVVGACGYGNLLEQGYGLKTAALTIALFDNGATFGTCYESRCTDSTWCRKGAGSIQITATNFCPLTTPKPNEFGATCYMLT